MNPNHTINIQGEILDLSSPKVMGIINVTPDSFFEGSRKVDIPDILKTAERMINEGADILDVGGYSSRPGAEDISVSEEMGRTAKAIEEIKRTFPNAIISIDTFRSEVAVEAVKSGASIVNDISAGHLDDKMITTVGQLKTPYVAMHMKGTPQTMKDLSNYGNIMTDIMRYFSEVLVRTKEAGIHDVILDPGFGFAKTIEQNFFLLKHLEHFHQLNQPLLVGLSRKSMIYKSLNLTADEALNGTTTLNTLALFKGASILRVHDIKEAVEVVKLVNQLA